MADQEIISPSPHRRFSDSLVYGREPVISALKSGRAKHVLITKDSSKGPLHDIKKLAESRSVPWEEADKAVLGNTAGTARHQGVLARVKKLTQYSIEEICEELEDKEDALVIIITGVEDPRNLGAIVRTALAADADGIAIHEKRTAPLGPAVAKTAAGALEWMKIAVISSTGSTFDYLKRQGFWVIGADQNGSEVFWTANLKGKIALVLGSEGAGLGKGIAQKCDHMVRIPQGPGVESLNISVAAALMIYECRRQQGHFEGQGAWVKT